MKTQLFVAVLLSLLFTLESAAISNDFISKCYDLKDANISLCISESQGSRLVPRAASVELMSQLDGSILLSGMPYILYSRSEDPKRNLSQYVTAAPNMFWDDLPVQAGLLSRRFSPIAFDGHTDERTLLEVGEVKVGDRVYEYTYAQKNINWKK